MYIVVFFSILALLFTYLESKCKMQDGMKWGFIFITLLGCIHYNYGNDYISYYEIGKQVNETPFDWNYVMSGSLYREPGWVLLNYLFKPIGGFFMMVACLNIFQNTVIYQFIKKAVPLEYRWFSVFIYLFVTKFYLINFSMMRQGFAVCVFLALWDMIKNKKWILPSIIIFLTSFIHSSIIMVLPLVFLGFLPVRNKSKIGIVFIFMFLLLWVSKDLVNLILCHISSFQKIEDYITQYGYVEDSDTSVGLGFLLSQLPVIVVFLFYFNKQKQPDDLIRMVTLSMFGIILQPLGTFFILTGRMALYFTIFTLAVFPIVYYQIKNNGFRLILISLYVILVVFDYIKFFSVDGEYYLHFHTIFEAL